METFIIQADSKTSKALVAIFEALHVSYEKKSDNSKDDDPIGTVQEEQSPYDPAFVKKILERAESAKKGNVITIDPEDLWGSLGLK